MPLYFWNDPEGEKYHKAYFDVYPNIWRHGDFGEYVPHECREGVLLLRRERKLLAAAVGGSVRELGLPEQHGLVDREIGARAHLRDVETPRLDGLESLVVEAVGSGPAIAGRRRRCAGAKEQQRRHEQCGSAEKRSDSADARHGAKTMR